MRIPRFSTDVPCAKELLNSRSKDQQIEIRLSDSQIHHLTNVIRVGIGETIEIIDSQSAITVRGEIKKLADSELSLIVKEVAPPADLRLTLILALIKPSILDDVVDKATQIGVNKFCFYHAERSKFKLDPNKQQQKLERLKRISEASLKQSGSSHWPEFTFHNSLRDALISQQTTDQPKGRYILLANTLDSLPEKPTNFATLLASRNSSQKISEIIVGPEGGLCQSEVEVALQQGFIATSLGEKTLRAETAAIVAAGICATYVQIGL